MAEGNKRLRTCLLVLARGGSKGIPGKNIINILGRPLIDYCLQAGLASGVFDDIWVSTEDNMIKETVQTLSPHFKVFDRNPETATDKASSESGIEDFVMNCPEKYDIYCLAQATSPLTRPEDFVGMMQKMQSGEWDSLVTTVTKHTFQWEIQRETGEAKPENYFPTRRPRRQDWGGKKFENGAAYVFTRDLWLTKHCRLAGRITYYEMPAYTEIELDNPYELKLLKALIPEFAYTPPFLGTIKLLVLDFDGVLTGCQKIYSTSGEYLKVFNMRDGHGISLIRKAGIEVKVITRSVLDPITIKRCKDLGIAEENILSGVLDKGPTFENLLKEGNYDPKEVAYMGDDIIDLDCLKAVGFSSCPSDAHDSIKGYCRFVSHFKGGEGAVRELCDYILNLLESKKVNQPITNVAVRH